MMPTLRTNERDFTPAAQELLPKVFLQPGKLLVTAEPTVISTIVGSCVSVCLWDPISRVGGMNHYLLAEWIGSSGNPDRFGNTSMERLVGQMAAHNCDVRRLHARIYGGACMIEALAKADGGDLGSRNARVAVDFLFRAGIRVLDKSVGGRKGRKIVFDTQSGSVTIKEL